MSTRGQWAAAVSVFCFACWLWAATAGAALAPYSPNADTLHLWHLDEITPPCLDSAPGGTNLTSLAGGATLSNSSFPGFGTALSTLDGGQSGTAAASLDALLAARPLVSGTGDDTAMAFTDPVNGAFTFEAIVRVDFNPSLNLGLAPAGTGRNSSLQILSGDGDATADRLFQFRLNPVGVGSGDTTVPRLEFINILGTIQTIAVAIPTNGPNAIASNQWYHVAVTYNGNQGTPNNFSTYWTLLDSNAPSANLIGSSSLNDDLPSGVACDFVIGNEGRATGGHSGNFLGLIDEVRISRVARAATNFFWQPPPPADDDQDGLPDSWEIFYFTNITACAGTNDPDGDLFDNRAEFVGSSNPTNLLSTPLDTDADGLPDEWEQTYLSSLNFGPDDDPDVDSFTNAQELAAGTHPNHAASNPNDTDADGLPDAWETTHFGSLAQTPGNDPDGDFFTNLQEYQAGTNPNNAESFPPGPQVRLIPIDDGNPDTSEFGYAGLSSINTVSFIRSGLMTVGDQQFITYYGRHATDASYAFNNRIWIGRRHRASPRWEVFRTSFTANNIADGHDVISFGIDGAGHMHMSWGMHGDAYHYAKSLAPVTGTNAITFGPDGTMTGKENAVTYPQFVNLPDGDLLYFFREGGSGNGDLFINRYFHASQTWRNLHTNGSNQLALLKGTGWTPNYNAYWNLPLVDVGARVFLTWTWRYNSDSPKGESGYQTNHDFDYAWSPDGGLTWRRSSGAEYVLPINERGENGNPDSIAEKILSIPEGSSVMNQSGACLDQSGQPVFANWWAPGAVTNNHRRQYVVAVPGTSGGSWQVRQISNRTMDSPTNKVPESALGDMGRPTIVCDRQDRLIVIYRDNEGGNGLTVVHSLPRALDPDRLKWTAFELTKENLGRYDTPVADFERWNLDNLLHVIYQPSSGQGYTPPANTAAQIGVLEWNAAAYFAHRPTLRLALVNGTNAVLRFNAQPGWGYRVQTSVDLRAWETLATLPGVAWALEYTHTNSAGVTSRFWRVQCQEGGF